MANDRKRPRVCKNTHGRDGVSKSFAKRRTSVVSFGISGRETQNEAPVRVVCKSCREFLHSLGPKRPFALKCLDVRFEIDCQAYVL